MLVSFEESPKSPRRRWGRWLAAIVRWLHIYVSLFGLTVLLFFSVTGITLNHPEWFPSALATTDIQDSLPPGMIATSDEAQIDKLAVVERLRSAHLIRGAVAEFRVEDGECVVVFKGPGYAADAFIDRRTGQYTVTETEHGLVAIWNDLHKGRDTGRSWAWVIDASAALMIFTSVTGFVLLFYLRRKRVAGVAAAVVGTVVVLIVYWWCVP